MRLAQVPFLADDKLDMLGDEIDTVSQLNQLRLERASKTRIDFNDDWATVRPPEFDVRWPPAKAESLQAAQRNINDTLMIVINQRGRTGRLAKDEMRWGAEVHANNPNKLIPHYLGAIKGTLCEFFDQYPRRRSPYVLPAQQIGRMFGYLIKIAAQSDTAAAAAYGRLKNHRQADFRGSAFYLHRIRCQAISRHWNAGIREELTLIEFVAAPFNRCWVRSW
ncbi:hypothetical protein A8146_14775 [Mesorhizobium loti]|nr:hypothetical protein A8146_14775 [Mesorhizobium loti]